MLRRGPDRRLLNYVARRYHTRHFPALSGSSPRTAFRACRSLEHEHDVDRSAKDYCARTSRYDLLCVTCESNVTDRWQQHNVDSIHQKRPELHEATPMTLLQDGNKWH